MMPQRVVRVRSTSHGRDGRQNAGSTSRLWTAAAVVWTGVGVPVGEVTGDVSRTDLLTSALHREILYLIRGPDVSGRWRLARRWLWGELADRGRCAVLRKLAAMGAVVALLAGLAVGAESGGAADHIDAPLARADLALDVGDIFVQQAPEDADDILIVVTASPAQVPGERRPWATREEGEYRVNIDRDGDAKRDARITVNFGSVRDDGSQQVEVRMGRRTLGEGVTGETIELRGGGRPMSMCSTTPSSSTSRPCSMILKRWAVLAGSATATRSISSRGSILGPL